MTSRHNRNMEVIMEKARLLFVDLETTGLSASRHCIIEASFRVATFIDPQVTERYHALVKPALGAAAASDKPAMDMHTASGLFERALNTGEPLDFVEKQVLELLEKSCLDPKTTFLAGNTVHFDRGFIEVHMPKLLKRMSHRVVDVSSLRYGIWATTGSDPLTFEKKRCHTSEEDLDETWREFRLYVEHNLG